MEAIIEYAAIDKPSELELGKTLVESGCGATVAELNSDDITANVNPSYTNCNSCKIAQLGMCTQAVANFD